MDGGHEWWSHYFKVIYGHDMSDGSDEMGEEIKQEYENLPAVTLSAFTETGRSESSILVPKQRSYIGRHPVIPSSVANIPCSSLSVSGMLAKLNSILCTSYTLTPRIYSLLDDFITNGFDFGTAYAYLRPFWYNNLTGAKDELRMRKEQGRKMREDVLVNNRIVDHSVPPRRVWDLCSNRVVPFSIARVWPEPISHAWVDEKDRTSVLTPINGFQWPVPIPRDASLNLVRIEMLNRGVECTWLDVLCLRQTYARGEEPKDMNKEWTFREDLRKKEWRLDVPTIGEVYRWGGRNGRQVTYYLNGLGRPLSLKTGDFESDRCWFRRAWTLQEICSDPIIGGNTSVSDDIAAITMEAKAQEMLQDRLSSLEKVWSGDVFIKLSEMKKRVSTNPMDKVVGLAYLLGSAEIPAYYETQSEEDVWTSLLDVLYYVPRGELFFLYPTHGDGNNGWHPSWKQVMTGVLPLCHPCYRNIGLVKRTKYGGADWYEGPCIESGFVRGLEAEGSHEGKPRQGELAVKDERAWYFFKIIADHQYSIPDGSYTLIGSEIFDPDDSPIQGQYWIAGQSLPEQRFRKVSVFWMPNLEEVERLYDLGIVTERKVFLV